MTSGVADFTWPQTPSASSRRDITAARRRESSRAARQDAWQECSSDADTAADDAVARGRRAIDRLLAEKYIDAEVAVRARDLIKFLFKATTVDASIAPEDGGLIFYWAAKKMSLTIEIYPASGYWWSARDIVGPPLTGEGLTLPLQDLKYQLNHFSKEVERQNPNWRSVIR